MRKGKRLYMTMAAVCFLLMGCDHVEEADRLIYVKPAEVSRAVLIEDFTGQRCINCPNAADEIQRLEEQYGHDKVIAVGIHGGALAVYTNSKVKGLRTALGDEYNTYWKVEAWPTGMVDRQDKPTSHDQWAATVRTELEKTSPIDLAVACDYDETTRSLHISTDVYSTENAGCKLQLWLTEDGITAPQQMPDGTMNTSYVHNHVLRAAINGAWGEDIVTKEGEHLNKTHDITLDEDWEVSNIAVVAFVYDDKGVRQVTKTKVMPTTE